MSYTSINLTCVESLEIGDIKHTDAYGMTVYRRSISVKTKTGDSLELSLTSTDGHKLLNFGFESMPEHFFKSATEAA